MKRDIMQNAGLEIFAEVAIIIFFIAFVLAVIRALATKKEYAEKMKNLPLEEEDMEAHG